MTKCGCQGSLDKPAKDTHFRAYQVCYATLPSALAQAITESALEIRTESRMADNPFNVVCKFNRNKSRQKTWMLSLIYISKLALTDPKVNNSPSGHRHTQVTHAVHSVHFNCWCQKKHCIVGKLNLVEILF